MTAGPPGRTSALLLGIDAGASHSTVVVANELLEIAGRADGPPAAVRPMGASASAAVIADTARRAAMQAGVSLPADRAAVGAAGAGRVQEQSELAAALVDARVARMVRVLPDGEVALTGAFDEGAGVVVNAGTGSIAFARDPKGAVYRSGGYGWQMGDEGSGYWLGRVALAEAARTADGRGAGSTLPARLMAALGLERFDDLVRWATTATPAQVAALAPHVLNAAKDGELLARSAVATAAAELAALVGALERHFPPGDPIRVATSGSLLSAGSPLADVFSEALARTVPRARRVTTKIDPAVSALKVAAGLK